MSLIKSQLGDYKIFLVNFTNDLRTVLNTFLTSEDLKCSGTMNIQKADSAKQYFKDLEEIEKKVVIVNFSQNLPEAFGFIVELRFGNNQKIRDTKVLIMGSMEKNYDHFSSLEGGADGFISVPLLRSNFLQTLTNLSLDLSRPSPYNTILELSTKFGFKGRNYLAELLLDEAKVLHPRPSLVLYQQGRFKETKGTLQEAFKLYAQALKYNKNHYMTLQAMFKVLVKQKRAEDAMKVLTRMFSAFPTPEVIIPTFIDSFPVEKKLELITLVDKNFNSLITDDNKATMRLSLYETCLKTTHTLIDSKRESEAAKSFLLTLKYCVESIRELTEIIPKILELKMKVFYETLWKYLPPKLKENHKIAVQEVEIIDLLLEEENALTRGQQIVKTVAGSNIISAYELVIKKATLLKMERIAEEHFIDAAKKWPDKAVTLRELTKVKIKKEEK